MRALIGYSNSEYPLQLAHKNIVIVAGKMS